MSTDLQPWDVAMALRDLSADVAGHLHAATTPTLSELQGWLLYINRAASAYRALETACEDVIEDGITEVRVLALKEALTCAQGQATYWRRQDRW